MPPLETCCSVIREITCFINRYKNTKMCWTITIALAKFRMLTPLYYLFEMEFHSFAAKYNMIAIVASNTHLEIFFSCDQAALWMVQSVCQSVCLSVCLSVTPLCLCSHHRIIMSYYQWQKCRPCKRSRSEVKGQGHKGQHSTWAFPDCNSSLNSPMAMKWYTKLEVA